MLKFLIVLINIYYLLSAKKEINFPYFLCVGIISSLYFLAKPFANFPTMYAKARIDTEAQKFSNSESFAIPQICLID